MFRHPWVLGTALCLVLVGCGKSDDTASKTTPESPASIDKPKAEPSVQAKIPGESSKPGGESASNPTGSTGTGSATASSQDAGLKKEDVKVGKGPAAEVGDTLWVLYTGKLTGPNGKVFDASDQHGNKPFAVTLGGGRVIQGWDLGLPGMKVGGERNLYIPYKLAYGDAGSQGIPPKADLFFNVKALAMVRKGEEDLIDIAVKKNGTGATPKVGDQVTVSYVGTLPGGTQFDKSKPEGLSFTVGRDNAEGFRAMPGIEQAVQNMKQGEEAIVTIPPKLGKPAGSVSIPPNSVLIFDLTLKKVGK